MSISTTLSNVLIEGNTIDAGSSFTYNLLLLSGFTDCRIIGNYFSGIGNDSINNIMLFLVACSCNVQGNTFVRGSNSISSYISSDGSTDNIITNNIFDGYTTDGSNLLLTNGLSDNTIYTGNKNQVGYSIIPLGTNKPAIFHLNSPIGNAYSVFNSTDIPLTATNDVFTTSGYLYDMMVLKIFDTETSPTSQHFTTSINVSQMVPVGAKIIDVKASIFNPSGGSITLTSGNTFTLSLNVSRNHIDSLDLVSHPSTGITSSKWMLAYSSGATYTTVTGSELYPSAKILEIPTLNYTGNVIDEFGSSTPVSNADISTNYVVGNDYTIMANLAFNYEATSTGSAATPLLLMSPIIITYVF